MATMIGPRSSLIVRRYPRARLGDTSLLRLKSSPHRHFSLFPDGGGPNNSNNSTTSNHGRKPKAKPFNDTDNDDDDHKSAPVIIPYSQSMPCPGHQWCTKCQIRAHAFQKPNHQVGTAYDACAALPAGTICPSAARYFRQQRNVMLGMATIVFLVPSAVQAVLAALAGVS